MKKSIFLSNEKFKSDSFKKNDKLNDIINELILRLKPLQKEVEKSFKYPTFTSMFIVGSPRSGTTILSQWIASLGTHSYGSNFLTRFAYSPYIGALIQKMIFDKDCDFHGDFHDINSSVNLVSNLGKSKGALAVNEFQHFFRNYMDNFDPEYLTDEQFDSIRLKEMIAGIASIESVFKKPLCTKAFMLQYNISNFYDKFKNVIFVYTRRKPIYNMQSIYLSRKKYFGSVDIWLGAKPKEYDQLKIMDIYHQIAGQVYYTNKAIEKALFYIPKNNKIIIEYENFCIEPEKYFQEIKEKYKEYSYKFPDEYSGVSSFNSTNRMILSKNEIKCFENAYQYFEKEKE